MSFFKDFKADFTQAMNELMPDGNEVYDDNIIDDEEEDVVLSKPEKKEKKTSKQKPAKTKKNVKKKVEADDLFQDMLDEIDNIQNETSLKNTVSALDEEQVFRDLDMDIAPEDMSDQIDTLLDHELYGDNSFQEGMIQDDVDVNTMDMSVEELLRQLDADKNDKEELVDSAQKNINSIDNTDKELNEVFFDDTEQMELDEVLVEEEDDFVEQESIPQDTVEPSIEEMLQDISDVMTEEIPQEIPDTVTEEMEPEIPDTVTEEMESEIPDAVTEEMEPEIPDTVTEEMESEIPDTVTEEIESEIPDAVTEEVAPEIPDTTLEEMVPDIIEEVANENPKDIPDNPETIPEQIIETLPEEEEIEVEFFEEEPEHIDNNTTNSIVNVEDESMKEDKDVISIKSVEDKTEKKEVEETKYNVDEASSDTTYITKGTKISGSIETDASIDIIGTVEGDVNCKGKVVVGGGVKGAITAGELYCNSARIEGDIKSYGSVKVGVGSMIIGNVEGESAVIAGAVNGDIDVKGPVIVDSTAVIMGNIKSRSVQINNGAVIEGFCSQSYSDIDVKSFFA